MNEFKLDSISQFKDWNWTSKSKLFILTGAGISAESGIPTFRDANGLWENHKVQEVASPEGYADDPEMVVRFYNERRKSLTNVVPNAGHEAIAKLQKELGDQCFLVTQNIDDLHESSGSPQVSHMHGELKSLKCVGPESHKFKWNGDQKVDEQCEKCGSVLRPNIVWFGEIPYNLDKIQENIEDCTHFIFIGTSSMVYPAAGYKHLAKEIGAKVMCIDLKPNTYDFDCHYYIEGKSGEILPKFVDEWINYNNMPLTPQFF